MCMSINVCKKKSAEICLLFFQLNDLKRGNTYMIIQLIILLFCFTLYYSKKLCTVEVE